jgi:chitosanase
LKERNMAPSLLTLTALAVSLLGGIVTSQTVTGADYNKPSAGPPASFFAATSTINVQALKTAAAKASKTGKSATYAVYDGGPTATIHTDWVNFATVSSFSPFPLN